MAACKGPGHTAASLSHALNTSSHGTHECTHTQTRTPAEGVAARAGPGLTAASLPLPLGVAAEMGRTWDSVGG
jgi:hypothetical protein